MSKTNFKKRGNECILFHALNYLHTQIDLHGLNNCYNLCHLPISHCYYQVRTKWLPQVLKFRGEPAYMCYLNIYSIFSLLNLINIPDASLNPLKVYLRAVVVSLHIP